MNTTSKQTNATSTGKRGDFFFTATTSRRTASSRSTATGGAASKMDASPPAVIDCDTSSSSFQEKQEIAHQQLSFTCNAGRTYELLN